MISTKCTRVGIQYRKAGSSYSPSPLKTNKKTIHPVCQPTPPSLPPHMDHTLPSLNALLHPHAFSIQTLTVPLQRYFHYIYIYTFIFFLYFAQFHQSLLLAPAHASFLHAPIASTQTPTHLKTPECLACRPPHTTATPP